MKGRKVRKLIHLFFTVYRFRNEQQRTFALGTMSSGVLLTKFPIGYVLLCVMNYNIFYV